MLYAVVHYPNTDTREINQLRKKYDPQFHLIEPHLTLVFPFPAFLSDTTLIDHVESVIKDLRPFPIHLQGLHRSLDDYLFLLVNEGSANLSALRAALYTGLLQPYGRADLEYLPHLTLGSFPGAPNICEQALEDADRLELNLRSQFDRIHIVKLDDEKTRIVWSKECFLGG